MYGGQELWIGIWLWSGSTNVPPALCPQVLEGEAGNLDLPTWGSPLLRREAAGASRGLVLEPGEVTL